MTSRAKQGGFSNWEELRNHAIDLFAETPHPATEQEIIDAYQLHPDAIAKAIEAIATDVAAGTARSGWGVLRKRATTIANPPSNPTRSSSLDREKQIARAEQWIRAAGCHIDRADEILEELFDDRGLLRTYAQVDRIEDTSADEGKWKLSEPEGDIALTTRMLDLWANHRPAGMQIERDAEQRAAKFRDHQAQLAALKAQVAAAREPISRKPLPEYDYSADPTDDIPF